jgi:hypothetical protein
LAGFKKFPMMKRLGSLMALDHESEPQDKVELTEVMQRAKEQIEYYLSAVNLDRDRFMREQMQSNENGFIFVDTFMNCNRIKQLGISKDDVLLCCSKSPFLVVDFEKPGIKPKINYEPDARRRHKIVRISGFSPDVDSNEIYQIVGETTTQPHNVLLQYIYDDSGDRTFTGVAHVLYFSEEGADRAVETPLFMGGKAMGIERLLDYEQRVKRESAESKK